MKCPECQFTVNEDDLACPRCGRAVINLPLVPVPSAPLPAVQKRSLPELLRQSLPQIAGGVAVLAVGAGVAAIGQVVLPQLQTNRRRAVASRSIIELHIEDAIILRGSRGR